MVFGEEKSKVKQRDELPDFDLDLSPNSEHNRNVAQRLGLEYESKRRTYVDEDGYLIADEFGRRF